MIQKAVSASTASHFPLLQLDEQADLAEKHHLETLLFCPNLWDCDMCSSTRTQARWYAHGAIGGIVSTVGRAKSINGVN